MEDCDDKVQIYKLAYDEGIRVVEDQVRGLEQLRTRVTTVFATVTTVSAFLVGIVVSGTKRHSSWALGFAILEIAVWGGLAGKVG